MLTNIILKQIGGIMDLINVLWTTLGSIVVLFILAKLMGYREVSEMSMFDYINGITIGSIAAEMATDIEHFEKPLLAMIIYALADVAISYSTNKSIKLRRFFTGKPLILMNNDKIYYNSLKKARLDVSEFLLLCRNSGYFDISDIQTAILECNGKLSILPKSENRPMTPKDMNFIPNTDAMVANVVIDGKIMYKNLHHTGKDEKWLHGQLKSQGIKDLKDVLLATCDIDNTVTVYQKYANKPKEDILD